MATNGTALLRATAQAAFWQRFESYPSIMDGLVYMQPSNSDQETYAWLAYAPPVREMTASRVSVPVPEISYTIKNKKWENTVPIGYELRKFGKNDVVANLVGEMGAKARAYQDALISSLIATGHSTACYDSQYFFDTDHVDPSATYTTTQNNDLTATITAPTAPTDLEWAAAMRSCIDALYSYKDGAGDPVFPNGAPGFIAMVPPGYRSIAQRVATVDQLTGPVGNDLKGMYRVVVNPWLNAPGTEATFFVFNATGQRKPFILQTADPVQLEDDMGGDNEFNSKEVHFGSFAYYNAGYGDWRYATKYVFT